MALLVKVRDERVDDRVNGEDEQQEPGDGGGSEAVAGAARAEWRLEGRYMAAS